MAALGLGDIQIAVWLGMAHDTVESHWRKMLSRFGVHARAAVVLIWLRGRSQPAEPSRPGL